MIHRALLCGLLLALVSPPAQAEEDRALAALNAQFTAAKKAAEAVSLAIYADQLELLRKSLDAKEETGAAEQVAAELKTVQSKLKALAPKPPAARPAPAK